MPDNIPEDHVPLEFLIDEAALKARYQEALKSGASPEFARTYVEQIARVMMVEEASTIGFRPDAVRRVLEHSVFKR